MPEALAEATPAKKPISPVWVGIAIALFPPLGLYLLWNHPTIGKSTGWWAGGILWGAFWLFANAHRPADSARSAGDAEASSTTVGGSTTRDQKSGNEISAEDLVELRNAATIRKKFAGRFVVTGRVMKVEDETGSFGRRKYMVSLVGTLNSRDLVNAWVECVMSTNGGLDKVGPGHFVKIEGAFDRSMGAVVYMKDCCLSKEYHSY